MIAFERRLEPNWRWTVCAFALAVAACLLATALLLATSGADIGQALSALWKGALGSRRAMISTLVNATPLILTGLATIVAFRAQIWSIGQEGQVLAGAMGGYLGALLFAGLPPAVFFPAVMAFGIAAGALLGGLCGWLRTRFGVNEIISTVMTNYLVAYLMSWLLSGGPWTEVGSVAYHQSAELPAEAILPMLFGIPRLHLGVVLPFAAALFCSLLLARMPLGYEIRGLGHNPEALRQKGVDVGRTIVVVMMISGGLAALAGAIELFGVSHRLRADNFAGLGYSGIIVGMIGGLSPLGTVVAGLFFGGLASGAVSMRVLSDTPAALVPAIQGMTLFFFLCAGVLARYRIVRKAP